MSKFIEINDIYIRKSEIKFISGFSFTSFVDHYDCTFDIFYCDIPQSITIQCEDKGRCFREAEAERNRIIKELEE